MKRHGNLWDRITSIENLENAHAKARRGKAHYSEVKTVDADIRYHTAILRRMLRSKTFTTSQYRVSTIFDGNKNRVIHKLPYWPDRVVQHALMAVVEPIFRKSLIRDTFQSIQGRGALDAFQRLREVVTTNPRAVYASKIDVVKFYPSVNNEILKGMIRRKLKCEDTLWLMDNIIDSAEGLPIGNYTSQILGNFYLAQVDWYIKQNLQPVGYFRYCDDIVLLASTKKQLSAFSDCVVESLQSLKLTTKEPIVTKINENGVDFVGYLVRSTHSRVRKRIVSNFIQSPGPSYKGWFLHNRSLSFFNKLTKDKHEI